MSRQKSGYIRSLAELVMSGELDLDNLPPDDEEAIALLTKIKGIGRWSAASQTAFAPTIAFKAFPRDAVERVTPIAGAPMRSWKLGVGVVPDRFGAARARPPPST